MIKQKILITIMSTIQSFNEIIKNGLPVDEAANSAVNTPTRYAVIAEKKIAYRTLGKGETIILCNRFRGILDSWDPAFLDGLAKEFR